MQYLVITFTFVYDH